MRRYDFHSNQGEPFMREVPNGKWTLADDCLTATTDLREGQMHLAMELERKDEQIRKRTYRLIDHWHGESERKDEQIRKLREALQDIQEITGFESSNPAHLLELIFEKASTALSGLTASGEAGKE